MNLKNLTKEELYDQINLYMDRIDTINVLIVESSNDQLLLQTYKLKHKEYNDIFIALMEEKERRFTSGEIKTISPEEYERDHFDKEFFQDIETTFKVKHFQRVESNIVDQDYDINISISVKTGNNRHYAILTLPVGIKEGYLLKREEDTIYYTGVGDEYDIEISFDSNNVYKIVIHQKKSGAAFIYT